MNCTHMKIRTYVRTTHFGRPAAEPHHVLPSHSIYGHVLHQSVLHQSVWVCLDSYICRVSAMQPADVWFPRPPPQPGPARANSPSRSGSEETWEASVSIGTGSRGAALGRAWGENLVGGSSRHLARVTAPFPVIHRLYISSPVAFPLGWSPFAQLEASVRCSSPLFFSFLCLVVHRFKPA